MRGRPTVARRRLTRRWRAPCMVPTTSLAVLVAGARAGRAVGARDRGRGRAGRCGPQPMGCGARDRRRPHSPGGRRRCVRRRCRVRIVAGCDGAARRDRASQDLAGRTVVEAIEPGSKRWWRHSSRPTGSTASPRSSRSDGVRSRFRSRRLLCPLSVGDRIDLVAAVSGSDASASPPFVLAANAVVVATNGQSITVAVPAEDAPRVALGIVTGSVVPALRPG